MRVKSASKATYRSLLKSQIIVITGAGASVPLGMPAMDGFSGLIDDRWKSLVTQIMARQAAPNNDLEYLLGRLEFYESIGNARSNEPVLLKWIPGVQGQLSTDAHDLKWYIFEKIIKTYGGLNTATTAKAVSIYHPMFTKLLDLAKTKQTQRPVLPIFTTNYDLTFEAIRDSKPDFKICNGIERLGENARWSRHVYERQTDYKFAIFRLHGCSHLMRRLSDGTISFQAYPDTKDSEFREPCLLYPIPGKEDRIFEQPFRVAYRHFELCLLEAKTVIIIGYSGRDPVIRAYLKEALELDPSKRVIVVTGSKQLRPELNEIKNNCTDFVHLTDGIETNVNRLLDTVAGKKQLVVGDSISLTDSGQSSVSES